MKICFVILAHHQPQMFGKLVGNISGEHSDIVVHLDKRADASKFGDAGRLNIFFMENRRNVHWSGWSLTQAILEGLEHGLRNSDADYFMYLAGTDFPIRSTEALAGFLAARRPANFLNYYPLVPGIWGYHLIDRIFLNDLKASLAGSLQDTKMPIGRRSLKGLLSCGEAALNVWTGPRNTTWTHIYSGSSRWCLNRETARFAVDYYRSAESRKLRDFLRFSANSDEIFFQTAILNSPLKEQCVAFDESEACEIFAGTRPPLPDEKRVYLHYIDWSPEREDPAILVDSDFQLVKESGKFFACKFMDDRSLALADRIERELL